jgi:cytidyltransferase-like protein
MLLQELFEAKKPQVGIIFGRFNPPHKGHKAAWEKASEMSDTWYVGTNKSTVGAKDPLPYEVKIAAMKAIWPEVASHIVADQSWLTLAANVYKKHGDVDLLCFTDEDWVTTTIKKYNGVKGPHGMYKFKVIRQVPTERLSSATALRNAVLNNNTTDFEEASGVAASTPIVVNGKKYQFFKLVAKYLLPYFKDKKVAEGLTDYAAPKTQNKGKISGTPMGKKKADMFGRNFAKSKPSASGYQNHPLRGKLVGDA